MPRSPRGSLDGHCYHALNLGIGRATVFHADYAVFLRCLTDALAPVPMRLLAYCLMPNHFHLVVWPHADGDLCRWMQRVQTAHVRRYHAKYRESGHVRQRRFKAFPIQVDNHLYAALRYVERNPVRANLADRAEG